MKAALLPLMVLAAACTPKAPAETPATPAPETAAACSADTVRGEIGKPYTPALGETMRKASGAKTIRALAPDSVATMDYRLDRLNIRLDGEGRVKGVDCG